MVEDMASAAEFTNLRLKYPGEDGLLFKDLTLSIRRNEKTLLLGPSGCGKSTLLQVLSGLVPRSIELPMKYGSIGVPSRSGYVFQDPDTQFCMPYVDEELAFVLENLKVPRAEMPSQINRLLELVGLRLDNAHTLISTFSQGMKQRLAIASALALEPEVLFLDEPTALLDPEGTRQVWDTLKRNEAGKTIVIVEHKIDEIVDWVDRVLVMGPNGDWLADGKPSEVFSSCRELLADYGIWHPGIWEQHLRNKSQLHQHDEARESAVSPNVERVKEKESLIVTNVSKTPYAPQTEAPEIPNREDCPRLSLEHFRGLRGGEVRIHAEWAEVREGQWIAVTGTNGAGKSSLLLGIMGLIKTEGVRKVEGLLNGKVEQMAEKAAFVFQNPELQFIAGSVEDEIAFSIPHDRANPKDKARKIDETLERFRLAPFRKRHPYQLSMGQKRRLSVAASLVRQQRLLLLDEPTFGLDAANTFALLEQLEELRASGTSIVMVTHDDNIARHYATRVWIVDKGILMEERGFIEQNALAEPSFDEGEKQLC